MRVKLDWLNELVDLTGLSIKEIVDTVSLYSIEVEGVDEVIHASDIVVGHVLTKTPHPDSDHLNLVTVDVGNEVLNIVCGAKNIEKDQYVIVAKEGCVLDGMTIKHSKIRGQESCGMVCSLQEIGIEKKYVEEKYQDGIYYFDYEVKEGTPAKEALGLSSYVLELGLTPNRGDMLSMIGVAYEFSCVFKKELKMPFYDVVRKYSESEEKLNISIQTPTCLTYMGQVIKNINIKPSPRWLISRLIAFGIRPINNSVDITNYILALFGQPLHAFDYDVLGKDIIIRNALENEEMITLDNQLRKLKQTDIVIASTTKAMCLGGVMGGKDGEVTPTTKNIMLEAAVFDPMTIRKTAARLNLHSEASNRYERGVDINRTLLALNYACYLYQTLCDADIVNDPTIEGIKSLEDKKIILTASNVNKLLGTNIKQQEIVNILESLKFKVTEKDDELTVMVPSRRPDITIKEDLIEEVGRIFGYSHLPSTHPVDDSCGELSNIQKLTRKVKDKLNGMGVDEVITYSLVNKEKNETFTLNHEENSYDIDLLMPLTEERSTLRKGLVPSLIEVAKYNYSRKIKNLHIFEIGRTYFSKKKEVTEENKQEKTVLAGLFSNLYSSTQWKGQIEVVDFYLVKGIVDEVLKVFNKTAEYTLLDKAIKEMHPNRSANIIVDNKTIGFIGQIHPQYAIKNDLDDIYVFEIVLDDLLSFSRQPVKFTPINRLPSVERDIALVMKKDVKYQSVIDCIRKSDKQILSDAYIFDLYEGENIDGDQKSLAIKLIFTSNEALTDEVINSKIKRILKDLEYKMGVTLRK